MTEHTESSTSHNYIAQPIGRLVAFHGQDITALLTSFRAASKEDKKSAFAEGHTPSWSCCFLNDDERKPYNNTTSSSP
jgi:hypothetical protein